MTDENFNKEIVLGNGKSDSSEAKSNENEERVEVLEESLQKECDKDEIDQALEEIANDEKKRRKRGGKKKKKKTATDDKIPSVSDLMQHPDLKKMVDAYVTDPNIKKLLNTHEKQKKETLKKKLNARINVLKDKRIPENVDNVKYDERGRKVGRIEKSYIDIPSEVDNPYDMDKLRKVMVAIAKDPVQKRAFMEKSGLSEEMCKAIMGEAIAEEEESGGDGYERIEQLI